MKFFFLSLLLAGTGLVYGQNVIELTADSVRTETLVITENTTIRGNGFSIICEGCSPAIKVTNGADLELISVIFPKVYVSWISVGGPESSAHWTGSTTSGSIDWARPVADQ